MPNWMIGVGGAIAAPILLALWAFFSKRANLYVRFHKWGTVLRNLGLGYDIPLIAGNAESTLKERILSTFSDGVRGLARGLAGKPLEEDGK